MRTDATRRYARRRSFLCSFLAAAALPIEREERETKGRKGGRVIASSRTTSGVLSRECSRQVEEKKGSRLPTYRTHTSTCTPRGKKDEASVKKRRRGGCPAGGERESRRPRKGGKEGREKDVGKGVGWRTRASATKTGGVRETDEGASREGKDVGREGRNRSLMRWWGGYVR